MLLMIDNYDSFTFNLVQYFAELGEEVRVFRNDEIDVAGIAAFKPDSLVLSPGPCSPKEAGICIEAIWQFTGKLPILGVCLGHQAIGAALGGKVIRAQKQMHGKTSVIATDGRGVYTGLPKDFTVIRYHSLAIERASLPAALDITATSEDGEIMGVRHRELAGTATPLEGVQFHPESILSEHGHAMLKTFWSVGHDRRRAGRGRLAQRHRDAPHGGDARRDGAGRGRRRRLRRRPEREPAAAARGGAVRQRGRAVHAQRHAKQPVRADGALPARRRVLVGQLAHTYRYEGGGAAVLGSIQPQPLPQQADGTLALADIAAAIKPDDAHFARTRLLCLENTWNGQVLAQSYLDAACALAHGSGLAAHLDGARLFNAAVASHSAVGAIAKPFDSVSVCFSKGLGAPVGSALVGSHELIAQARRLRKMLGGGMRQAGLLAAAANHALDHHVERLADDHANARRLADGLARIRGLSVVAPDTNIVFASLDGEAAPARTAALLAHLAQRGVLATGMIGLRFVTHLDVDAAGVDRAVAAVAEFMSA